MELNGFSSLMFIFSLCIILAGFYIYTGHKSRFLLWHGYTKNITKEKLRIIGKWRMLTSIIPFILGIIGLFLDV